MSSRSEQLLASRRQTVGNLGLGAAGPAGKLRGGDDAIDVRFFALDRRPRAGLLDESWSSMHS